MLHLNLLFTGMTVPSGDCSSKYTPAQGRRVQGVDLRPPSRQKTPTKAVGLDDPDESSKSSEKYDSKGRFGQQKNPDSPKQVNGKRACRQVTTYLENALKN